MLRSVDLFLRLEDGILSSHAVEVGTLSFRAVGVVTLSFHPVHFGILCVRAVDAVVTVTLQS